MTVERQLDILIALAAVELGLKLAVLWLVLCAYRYG